MWSKKWQRLVMYVTTIILTWSFCDGKASIACAIWILTCVFLNKLAQQWLTNFSGKMSCCIEDIHLIHVSSHSSGWPRSDVPFLASTNWTFHCQFALTDMYRLPRNPITRQNDHKMSHHTEMWWPRDLPIRRLLNRCPGEFNRSVSE